MRLFSPQMMKLKRLFLICLLISVKCQELITENNTETDEIAQEVPLSENQENVPNDQESNIENGADGTVQENTGIYGKIMFIANKKELYKLQHF